MTSSGQSSTEKPTHRATDAMTEGHHTPSVSATRKIQWTAFKSDSSCNGCVTEDLKTATLLSVGLLRKSRYVDDKLGLSIEPLACSSCALHCCVIICESHFFWSIRFCFGDILRCIDRMVERCGDSGSYVVRGLCSQSWCITRRTRCV